MFRTQLRSAQDIAYVEQTGSAPTINDDASLGYKVGDRWLHTSIPVSYELLDATIGAAVWKLSDSFDATKIITAFVTGVINDRAQEMPMVVIDNAGNLVTRL